MNKQFKEAGCNVTDFIFHVTLGREPTAVMDFETVRQKVNDIKIPPFTLKLSQLTFRVRRGKDIANWKLN